MVATYITRMLPIVYFCFGSLTAALAQKQLNVVMIAVDDLRPTGSMFGDPEVKVPNIDRLAKRSTIFKNAFVQAATCGVSRSSLLTSRRPDSTYVLQNGKCPFETAPSHSTWQSLPEYFKASGYVTAGFGKIFHPNVCDGAAAGERKQAWSLPYYHAPCISLGSIYNGSCYESYPGPLPEGPGGKVTSIFSNTSAHATDDTMPDGMIADQAIATLKTLVQQQQQQTLTQGGSAPKPFFLAMGLHKPHLPHIAPAKYFDLYPLGDVSLPSNASRHAPQHAPDIAWNGCGEWKSYKDVAAMAKAQGFSRDHPIDDDQTRRQRRAYYAAASYSDAQIGRLLSALDGLGIRNETVIALWGDHGWHLGENNEWAKHTAMTWANRAPLLFSHPGGAPAVIEDGFAEFVDIYPTLAGLAGIPEPTVCATEDESQHRRNCTEGQSLAALVRGERSLAGAKTAAFSQWPKGGKMGYNVFTRTRDGSFVRYTEWVKYKNHGPVWVNHTDHRNAELYNRTADPDENVNIVKDPGVQAEVQRLSQLLHTGWRKLL